MSSVSFALRQARGDVMPLVQELAPGLPELEDDDSTQLDVVQQELNHALSARGTDPDTISPVNFNKLTRNTLAGAMIDLQRKRLVEGEGREAVFCSSLASLDRAVTDRRSKGFSQGIAELQWEGISFIKQKYTAGSDSATSWLPGLARRYYVLGKYGLAITPKSPHRNKLINPYPPEPLPEEGQSIYIALSTRALSSTVDFMFKFVRKEVKGTKQRIEAAHDIAPHFLGGIAAAHFYEMTRPTAAKGKIIMNDKTEHYQFRQTPEQRHKLFTHLKDEDLPNDRMKCPAHAAVAQGDTNMLLFAHAAINLAAERYDLL